MQLPDVGNFFFFLMLNLMISVYFWRGKKSGVNWDIRVSLFDTSHVEMFKSKTKGF